MKHVAQPDVLDELTGRLNALRPDTPRRWGTLTPGEMLCHLGDATESVLGQRKRPPIPLRPRRQLVRWVALYVPLRWPRGVATSPHVDPRAGGTRPGDFEQDRKRAIAGLEALATAPADRLASVHSIFGAMTRRDWWRWAYLHTDHHLRQFGL